jgi:hypothetical protein
MILEPYKSIKHKVQDKNDKFSLVSLVTISSKEGYNVLFSCANEIIKVNKQEEEKRRLFDEKVLELRKLFESESLDKLKELNFIHNSEDDEETKQEPNLLGEGEGETGERDQEESRGVGQQQDEDDS